MSNRRLLLFSGLFLSLSIALTTQLSANAPPHGVRQPDATLTVPTPGQDNAEATQQPLATSPAPPPASPTPAQQFVIPAGTRLALVMRNGINTRTAKPGDSVYFETIYPIAQNNRILIPIGSFVRGQLLQSKRPGLVKGRGEIRMALDQITFPNGYVVALAATPNSADRAGREGVDREGTVKGRSGTGRDVGLVLVTTGAGAYIGTLAGAITNGAAGTGALIGSGIGAAAGIIAILATRGPEAELPRGTTLDVIFDRPLLLDAALLPANDPGHLSSPLPPAPPSASVSLEDRRRRISPLGGLIPLLR